MSDVQTATPETSFVVANPPEKDINLVFDPMQMKIKEWRRVEQLKDVLLKEKRNPNFDEMIELVVYICSGLTPEIAEELTIQQLMDFWKSLENVTRNAVPKASGTPSSSGSKGTTGQRPRRGQKPSS